MQMEVIYAGEGDQKGLNPAWVNQDFGCSFEPYFFLNFSMRPAVSMNFILPVKKGWDIFEISSFTKGYSFPSSQTMVSRVAAVERHKKALSTEKSLNTTRR